MYELVRAGVRRNIYWASDASGRFRAKTYYEGLDVRDRAGFDALFAHMSDQGSVVGAERFRKEFGEIYCFKRGQHRLACFYRDEDLMIVSGFQKKTLRDKRSTRDLQTAVRLRTEFLTRDQNEESDESSR